MLRAVHVLTLSVLISVLCLILFCSWSHWSVEIRNLSEKEQNILLDIGSAVLEFAFSLMLLGHHCPNWGRMWLPGSRTERKKANGSCWYMEAPPCTSSRSPQLPLQYQTHTEPNRLNYGLCNICWSQWWRLTFSKGQEYRRGIWFTFHHRLPLWIMVTKEVVCIPHSPPTNFFSLFSSLPQHTHTPACILLIYFFPDVFPPKHSLHLSVT